MPGLSRVSLFQNTSFFVCAAHSAAFSGRKELLLWCMKCRAPRRASMPIYFPYKEGKFICDEYQRPSAQHCSAFGRQRTDRDFPFTARRLQHMMIYCHVVLCRTPHSPFNLRFLFALHNLNDILVIEIQNETDSIGVSCFPRSLPASQPRHPSQSADTLGFCDATEFASCTAASSLHFTYRFHAASLYLQARRSRRSQSTVGLQRRPPKPSCSSTSARVRRLTFRVEPALQL